MTATWRSVSAKSATIGADPVVTKPTGTVDGDLLIAIGVTAVSQTITAPAGWTTASWSLGAGAPAFWKIAASEPANYTFVASGSGTTIVSIVRIDGHDPTTPFDAGSGNYVNGSGALAIPSVTSAGANRLLMQMCVKLFNTTFTGPGSQTERYDAIEATASVVYAGGDEIVGSGATGTRTWTPAGGAGAFTAYMAAIAPTPVNATVSAVVATATGTAPPPTVTATQSPTVAAVAATSTGAAVAPTVSGQSNVTVAAVTATTTILAFAPAVAGVQNVTVTAVAATATTQATAPTVVGTVSATATAVVATATATAVVPVVVATKNGTVSAVAAVASALALAPTITAVQNAAIQAVAATATAMAPAPLVFIETVVAPGARATITSAGIDADITPSNAKAVIS